MTKRLTEIFSVLENCHTFADVGCDHGYVAKAMLKSGKCERVIVSDISEKCLKKAEDLLALEIAEGKAISVVSDGFRNVGYCDQALIAGMGGEEIISILSSARSLPEKLVLQPMKNVDKVREKAVSMGYKIKSDYVFRCGKIFYDLITLVKGEDSLTEEEIEFGRTNINAPSVAFKQMLESKIKKYENLLSVSQFNKDVQEEIKAKIEKLKKYV